MKAAVIPELNGTWELRDIPQPQAEAGQVLIRVRACGICFTDVWTTRGAAGDLFPNTPGHEVVGEVVEVGEGVTGRQVGDRVGTTWVQSTCGRCAYCSENLPLSGQAAVNCAGPARLTGFTTQGGHAEYIAATATGTVLIPDELSFEHAAPLFCAGYTTWSGIRAADPQPKDRIAVVGIGGLGHLALQFSKANGFETIAVTHSADKHDLAKELGADHVVSDGAELQATGGADVMLLCSNSYEHAGAALQGLRHDGRAVLVGLDPFGDFTIPTYPQPFFAQRQKFIGATHNGLRYLTEALDMAAAGKVKPMIEVFDKEQVADAVAKVAAGDVRFRAVVRY